MSNKGPGSASHLPPDAPQSGHREKKPFWTAGKIIVAVVTVLVLIAVIAFALLSDKDSAPSPTSSATAESAKPLAESSDVVEAEEATQEASETPRAVATRNRTPYKGFWYGLKSKEELVALIDRGYAQDPTGRSKISEKKCAKDGSCASLMNFLEAFRAYDPAADLKSVADLPAYVRKLELDCTIKGRFMMADIYLPSLSARGRTETNRMSRNIRDGECVLKNPDTGRPVIAMWCANPVGKKVLPAKKPPCYIIPFNYQGQAGITRVKGDRASVSGHFAVTQAQMQDIVEDECTFVEDADGRRKPGLGPCTVNCPPGWGWPPDALATAVGLPPKRLSSGEPHGEINFTLKHGKGYLSLPADTYWKMVYCVLVEEYPVRTTGFEGWSARSRFDTVTKTDLNRTRSAGKLDRALWGSARY